MKKKALTITAFIAMGVLLTALTGCRGHGPHRGSPEKRAEFMINRLKAELDLSEQQVQLLNDIHKDIRSKMEENRPQREQHFELLKEQILADSLDTAEIKRYMDAQQNKHREMRDYVLQQIKRFHDTLTSEQKQKLVSLLEEFKGAWYNHHGGKF
ncbi:MAG: Spy/CpxP family protein refolding chaperone [Spirochaetales bacterium]|nr:Spy/CpxP family protein refolding chaperone [Spirochaetales bacterium]